MDDNGNRRHLELVTPEAPDAASPPADGPDDVGSAGEDGSRQKDTQATRLVKMALETPLIEFWHDADERPFVTLPVVGHRETWPLKGGPFKDWLAQLFYRTTGKAASSSALTDALRTLEGEARFIGREIDVHIRLAEHDGAIWLDLGDDAWRAVRISATGWTIEAEPPVRFVRPRGLRPLPAPVSGGEIRELADYVNVTDEDWPLLAAWVVAALRPRGPFPVLQLHGEQGSAKSTTARVLRDLVDPNAAPLRAEPRDGRDLVIAARNGWVISLDNLSHLSVWLSDGVCRLATGGGFATRELYTDTDETIIDVQRPTILNGIESVATRSDLLDRSLVLDLPRIRHYRDEREFWTSFRRAQPRILGAFLDAVATGLSVGEVQMRETPRMADFAKWAVAALEVDRVVFLAAYNSNRASAHAVSLEASPLAEPLRQLVAAGGFTGTAAELLDRLGGLVDETTTKTKSWPKRPHVLSGQLRRLAPDLRAIGVEIEWSREGHERSRIIDIRTDPGNSVRSVRSVRTDGKRHEQADTADVPADAPADAPDAPADARKPHEQAKADAADAADALLRTTSSGDADGGSISDAERQHVFDLMHEHEGMTPADVAEAVRRVTGQTSTKRIRREQYDAVCAEVQAWEKTA